MKLLLSKFSNFLIKLGVPFEWVLKWKIVYDQLFSRDRDYMEAFHNRWGDLWKDYYRDNYIAIPEKINALKNNMPEDSRILVDTIFERNVFLLPWQKNNKIFLYNIKMAFTEDELKDRRIFRQKLKKAKRNYKLAADLYDESTFCTNCGLDHVPSDVKNSIQGRDILDIGAFIGDSGLIFSQFSPRKIYAFEPERTNFKLLQKTISVNNLDEIIIPVPKGIGDKEEKRRLNIDRAASTLFESNAQNDTVEIELTTIDNFANNNNLDVSLIKMDIEGLEYAAVNGAMETIMRCRPILLIAVYHTPTDFFEIKPLLEGNLLNYKYILKKLTPYHPTYETTLIAYSDIS